MIQVRGFLLFLVRATFTNSCFSLALATSPILGTAAVFLRGVLGLAFAFGLVTGFRGLLGARFHRSSSWPLCFLLDQRRLIDVGNLRRVFGVQEPATEPGYDAAVAALELQDARRGCLGL